MPTRTIPSASWWHPIRDAAKKTVRAVAGPRAYSWVAAKYSWGTTLLNYALMRVPGLDRIVRIGAWPHSLYIEGTNICNAECVFCAYPEMQRPKKVMPMELFKSVIDQYAAMGGTEVDLTPIVGDPFVDGKIFERLDYLASKPELRRFHFFTNAIGMKPELSQKLLKYGAKLRVYISFGGFDRQTYLKVFGVDKFDAAAPNIKAAIEAKRASGSTLGLQINLRTPRDNNKGELWDYFLAAKKDGVIEMTWMGAFDSWAGHIKERELTDAGLVARPMPVKKGPCHWPLTGPVVLADGRVNACAARDVEATLIIGDLGKQSLSEILSGPALRELLDRQARGDHPDVCRRCTYYDPVLPYWVVGQPDRKDPAAPVDLER
ncbi:MAG: radical SAM protein [Elusimicrobia bacterium]|nr:radical SAM protein [Elusimicrobiota bacterium]